MIKRSSKPSKIRNRLQKKSKQLESKRLTKREAIKEAIEEVTKIKITIKTTIAEDREKIMAITIKDAIMTTGIDKATKVSENNRKELQRKISKARSFKKVKIETNLTITEVAKEEVTEEEVTIEVNIEEAIEVETEKVMVTLTTEISNFPLF